MNMAIIKMRRLREMTSDELNERLRELKLELSKELASSEIGTAKNPAKIKNVKRTIAKIETILYQRKVKVR